MPTITSPACSPVAWESSREIRKINAPPVARTSRSARISLVTVISSRSFSTVILAALVVGRSPLVRATTRSRPSRRTVSRIGAPTLRSSFTDSQSR